ncbi:MAG: hypothetical protein AXA67_07255 [Methylothermaceae bacteria B42]|nr:MAG: hypothetical protein AXA67_07255 [Methylothermaceae bacteria B42]HHJ40178.1 ABC transporter permease [Methylothermaceae bacterium]
MIQNIKEGWRFRHALWQLTLRNLAQHTRGSVLGVGWLLLEPMFLFAVYTVVFGYLMKVRFDTGGGVADFALYLLCGLIPFDAMQQTAMRSTGILIGNRPLLLHAQFPGWLLPVVEVLTSLVTELMGLIVLLAAIFIKGYHLSPWLALLPVLMLTRLMVTAGMAWVSSVLTVFVRDFSQLLRMLLMLAFFATPVIYPLSLIPNQWRWLEDFNPFYWLVAAYRAVFLQGVPPPAGFWWLLLGSGIFSLLAWIFFNKSLERAKDFL